MGRTMKKTMNQVTAKTIRAAVMDMSDLFQFDETAVEILGMQEQHGLAVGADLRLSAAQHPCA